MPLTAAQTKTALENQVQNPKEKFQRKIVHVDLIMDGIEFNPKTFYEALDTLYGTVASERDTIARNDYIFRISA